MSASFASRKALTVCRAVNFHIPPSASNSPMLPSSSIRSRNSLSGCSTSWKVRKGRRGTRVGSGQGGLCGTAEGDVLPGVVRLKRERKRHLAYRRGGCVWIENVLQDTRHLVVRPLHDGPAGHLQDRFRISGIHTVLLLPSKFESVPALCRMPPSWESGGPDTGKIGWWGHPAESRKKNLTFTHKSCTINK